MSVLDKFYEILKENVDAESITVIQESMDKFKETLKVEAVEVAAKAKKGAAKADKPKRQPTAYNKFISEQMRLLKESDASLTSQQRMSQAMGKWKELSVEEKAQYSSKTTSQATTEVTEKSDETASKTASDVESEVDEPKSKPTKKKAAPKAVNEDTASEPESEVDEPKSKPAKKSKAAPKKSKA